MAPGTAPAGVGEGLGDAVGDGDGRQHGEPAFPPALAKARDQGCRKIRAGVRLPAEALSEPPEPTFAVGGVGHQVDCSLSSRVGRRRRNLVTTRCKNTRTVAGLIPSARPTSSADWSSK